MISASVMTPARRHMRAKKKVAVRWAMAQHHQIQFPLTPSAATIPVTASGVSAANVVATMLVPRIHQGRERPARKYSDELRDARRRKARPRPRVRAR